MIRNFSSFPSVIKRTRNFIEGITFDSVYGNMCENKYDVQTIAVQKAIKQLEKFHLYYMITSREGLRSS